MTPLVTAINEKYFPGLVALYNSYKKNAGDGFEFYCIVDGDDGLVQRVEALGVNAIRVNAWKSLPTSPEWPEQIQALYVRLQIPALFSEHDRAIWIDADCVIVKPLTELLELDFEEPMAACSPPDNNYTMGFVLRNCPRGKEQVRAPFTALVVFNVQEWNRRDITCRCGQAMLNSDVVFRYADQSLLAYVLEGDFHILDMKWQTWANRKLPIKEDSIILHWVGVVPWLSDVPHKTRWLEFYEMEEQA